ncbi:MAG: hypothetical protein U0359_31595 [Byssovorax sp.]
MKRWGQTLIFVLCVLFSVAAAYNVMSDNAEVEKLAVAAACSDNPATQKGCDAQKTRIERTPLAQTFEIHTSRRTVEVRCTRALVFVGDYACAVR